MVMTSSGNFISRLDDTSSIVREEPLFVTLFKQYERVVIESLITTFGLDFFITDQHGGDVDTIHNVRLIGSDPNMSYKSKANEQEYQQRGTYNIEAYHSDPRFTIRTKEARERYNTTGEKVVDEYTGVGLEYTTASDVPFSRRASVDHVVECEGIHNDPGRVLAGIRGLDLANDESNFAFTNRSLNSSMGKWANHKNEKYRKEHGCDAPLDELSIDAYLREYPQSPSADPEILAQISDPKTQAKMRRSYTESRKAYEARLQTEYYTSRKFFSDTSTAALKRGGQMGLKAALGVVFAELWFTIKDKISKSNTNGKGLFRAIGNGIKEGLINARTKFKDIWDRFLSGTISGVMSSLVTTLANIFFRTAKSVVKLIRQTWSSLIEATKILLFNPDCLRFGERIRAASKVLAAGASIAAGIMVSEVIAKTPLGTIPVLGDIVATFCGTLVTGIMTCSLLYILDRNEMINKIVKWLDKLPTIENYIAYAKEQASRLEEYAAKVYDLDIMTFRLETNAIIEAVGQINDCENDSAMLLSIRSVYKKLNWYLPWGGYESFDEFMNDENSQLNF